MENVLIRKIKVCIAKRFEELENINLGIFKMTKI